ncbi:hypothetical protein [Lactobacillus gallinarum]|uniref:hypothetical protein n=1 Tax=Lactobacillus gallinarum TaxID=52242 RepID=UPI000B390614|nr:hypothetical protein [Lactobacillus gallinarum]OUQ50585.1 hypothetical protein B5E63_01025 [Lactobacillus gallinarum]
MNNQETNQTVNQPETVAPVTSDQTTQATASATDTKLADNTQDATASTPVAPTVPDSVKLDLSADQAEMVQDLLSEYDYAYRSDREVDCKRELVRRDKIGKYPYVAEPPAPEIINPVYDWINKKWYSKNGSTSLPEIAQSVANLNKKSTEQDQAALANGQQMQMITKQLGNQMTMMKQMQQTLAILAKNSQPTVNTDTNGGNN